MPEMVSSIESFRPVTSIAIRLIAQKRRHQPPPNARPRRPFLRGMSRGAGRAPHETIREATYDLHAAV